MSAEYATQVIASAPVTEVQAFCGRCRWNRVEDGEGAYQHFLNEAKSHTHLTGHTVTITRASATTTTVTRRALTERDTDRNLSY